MFVLQPQKQFAIVRKLSDPSDTSTYYVRAVVRNSINEVTIATYDLVDQGGQRFKKVVSTPADVSGTGLQIDITTKVYSDSGYTVQDTSYSDEINDYLVMQVWNPAFGHGGSGGGADIDYKKIKKIVEDVLDEKEAFTKDDLNPLKTNIQHLARLVEHYGNKEIEKPEIIELEPLTRAISAIAASVSTLTEKLEKIPTEKVSFKSETEEIIKSVADIKQALISTLETSNSEIKVGFGNTTKLLDVVQSMIQDLEKFVAPVINPISKLLDDIAKEEQAALAKKNDPRLIRLNKINSI